jgi:molybdopterin-guanine dinucleotide biosynthesis protein A
MTPLYGLVLSGGKSTRMGRDKGSLVYSEGLDQRSRGLELLSPFCEKVFVSVRRDQSDLLPPGMPRIIDQLSDAGPAAGILAAWQAHPVAWLVLACDFPYVNEATVADLVAARSGEHATAYVNSGGLLEPLFAIWEPGALQELETQVSHGRFSPLRALAGLEFRAVPPRNPSQLLNVNSHSTTTS